MQIKTNKRKKERGIMKNVNNIRKKICRNFLCFVEEEEILPFLKYKYVPIRQDINLSFLLLPFCAGGHRIPIS